MNQGIPLPKSYFNGSFQAQIQLFQPPVLFSAPCQYHSFPFPDNFLLKFLLSDIARDSRYLMLERFFSLAQIMKPLRA